MKKKTKMKPVSMSKDFAEWLDSKDIPNFSKLVCDLLKTHLGNGNENSEEQKLFIELKKVELEKKDILNKQNTLDFELEMLIPKQELLIKKLYELNSIKYEYLIKGRNKIDS